MEKKENRDSQVVYDTMLARRSVRNFQQLPVEHEKIVTLLKAAMAAPSACNLEPWTFIVVDDPEVLSQVKDATSQGKYNAPLAIVVCGISKHIPWDGDGWLLDCGAAAQNIMLEAVELGLASVCIGGFEESDLRTVLAIPEEEVPVCILELGYPAENKKPHTWYTEEAVHWQQYDTGKTRTLRTIDMLWDDVKAGV